MRLSTIHKKIAQLQRLADEHVTNQEEIAQAKITRKAELQSRRNVQKVKRLMARLDVSLEHLAN